MIRPAVVVLVAATRHRTKLRHRRAHPQLAVAAILSVAGVFVSLGLGAFLPNVSRLNSATLTAPTVHAMLALLLAIGVLATPAVASTRIDGAARAAAVAVGGTAVVGGLAGAAGYRYAERRLVRSETVR